MENDHVYVTYHKTHYNHKFEIQHVRISKTEREKIAEKLLAGLSVSE